MAKTNSKPHTATEKGKNASKELPQIPLLNESLAKKIFIGLAAALFVLMVSVSKDYGISGDENFHRMYGHHIVDFYKTLGKDTTAATTNGPDSLMVFYGGLFDGSSALVARTLPQIDEWNIRHFINSIFGYFAMLCAALVTVEIVGWQAGIIALIFMAASPRFFGESMNNPKDITMAAGYMFAYVFILKFLKQLPKPSVKVAIGLGLSIGMAMGIRIGGLLLIPYTFMFYGLGMLGIYGFGGLLDFSKFKEQVWPSLKLVLLAVGLGYFSSLIFWPYGLVAPFSHPLEALNVAQKFPATIKILFEGNHIMSTEVPWYYIPKWLMISTPLFGLLGLIGSLFLIEHFRRNGKLLMLAFLFFTIVFPLGYVVYKKSVLYDTMRHFFFVYPSIVILSAISFNFALNAAPKMMKYAVLGVILVLLALPVRFMLVNHPNEYVYFNEIVGGIKGAFGNYETDYYMNSVKQCVDWLKANENLKRSDGRKSTVYSNAIAPVGQYFRFDTSYVGCGYSQYRQRSEKNADYEIMYCRFIDRNLLLKNAFPPEQSIYTVYADGVPLSCVIKKTDKRDYEGMQLMEKGDYAGASAQLEGYAQKYPTNEVVLANLGLCYLNLQQFDKAATVLTQSLALSTENTNAQYWLGLSYMYKQDYSNAAQILTNVVKENPYFPPPYRALAECMARLGDQNSASYYAGIYQQLSQSR
ncbi:MAG: tetratricopeptide repeat protein [Bacteroidetes bacterium]|nr:tetratricopeptide repeat protein [Bacteroidota bacterium]